jgi:hypothetical protein
LGSAGEYLFATILIEQVTMFIIYFMTEIFPVDALFHIYPIHMNAFIIIFLSGVEIFNPIVVFFPD